MEINKEKNTKNKKEKVIAFIYVALFFLVTTIICCSCLLYYNSSKDTRTQKEFAINKMDRIKSFQVQQSSEMIIVDSLFHQIKAFNPDINASYEESDIKFYLNDLKHIYTGNSYDTRYKIFLQVSNYYSMWFDDKKELWSRQKNIMTFKKNLEDCEIGLQKKIDELKGSKK